MPYTKSMRENCLPRPEKIIWMNFRAHGYTFTIKEGKTDIVFSGLGWVTVQQADKKITAYAPKGVHVFVRRSLI